MPQPVVAVLGTRYSDLRIEAEILQPTGARLRRGEGADDEAVLAVAGDADVVLAGSGPRFSAAVLRRLRCRGIVRYGVGTETIDTAAARELGIAVARVADYGTEAVAFHTLALALALLRRLPAADATVRAGGWGVAELRPLHLPSALTAGVIGYGRIGRQTATYLRGLGFAVCAFDEYVDVDDDRVSGVTLEELLAGSDVVTLHVPAQAGGEPLLDSRRLTSMRPGSVLVNTARGSLIDVAALVDGLRAGRPALAALDVFPDEPPDLGRFADVADRVLLTPHMAWYTEQSEIDLRRKAAEEAVRMLRGEPLSNPVVVEGALRRDAQSG